MIGTNQFKRGMKIELEGEPFTIIEFQHVKPGKGGAFVRTKLKSLITGNVIDRTFRSGERSRDPILRISRCSICTGMREGLISWTLGPTNRFS